MELPQYNPLAAYQRRAAATAAIRVRSASAACPSTGARRARRSISTRPFQKSCCRYSCPSASGDSAPGSRQPKAYTRTRDAITSGMGGAVPFQAPQVGQAIHRRPSTREADLPAGVSPIGPASGFSPGTARKRLPGRPSIAITVVPGGGSGVCRMASTIPVRMDGPADHGDAGGHAQPAGGGSRRDLRRTAATATGEAAVQAHVALKQWPMNRHTHRRPPLHRASATAGTACRPRPNGWRHAQSVAVRPVFRGSGLTSGCASQNQMAWARGGRALWNRFVSLPGTWRQSGNR